MPSTKRYVAVALGGIGFLMITFVSAYVRPWASRDFLVGLSIAGGVLLIIGIVWSERRRQVEGTYDERIAAIQFRSGWYAFWAIMALAITIMSISVHTEMVLPPWGMTMIVIVGSLVYPGAQLWLKRRM